MAPMDMDAGETAAAMAGARRVQRRIGTTHTYVTLDLSAAAYDEIRKKLEEAEYSHAFHEDGCIDMHGIAVAKDS